MCGILGLWQPNDANSSVERRLNQSLKVLNHRGPDDRGIWLASDNKVGFGHVRLSIIDTSTLAHQPMVDTSSRYILVFNGEIYNYKELYKKYLLNERAVNSHSDTSVLMHLLIFLGKDALSQLNGMFSFAFYDTQTKKVLLARDRFGEKPLYWLGNKNVFAFSSELSALKVLLYDHPWILDDNAIASYHMLGSIPAPQTIYKDVFALEPGQWIERGGMALIHMGNIGVYLVSCRKKMH